MRLVAIICRRGVFFLLFIELFLLVLTLTPTFTVFGCFLFQLFDLGATSAGGGEPCFVEVSAFFGVMTFHIMVLAELVLVV